MAGYSLYDLLRTLIERVGWQDEQEKKVALQSVTEAEEMNIFGNLAAMMACPHDNVQRGRCTECGRIATITLGR